MNEKPKYLYRGRMMTNAELAVLAGVSNATMFYRLNGGRMSPEEAVSRGKAQHPTYTHDGITDTVDGWARRVGIPQATLHGRLANGWAMERALSAPTASRRRRSKAPLVEGGRA